MFEILFEGLFRHNLPVLSLSFCLSQCSQCTATFSRQGTSDSTRELNQQQPPPPPPAASGPDSHPSHAHSHQAQDADGWSSSCVTPSSLSPPLLLPPSYSLALGLDLQDHKEDGIDFLSEPGASTCCSPRPTQELTASELLKSRLDSRTVAHPHTVVKPQIDILLGRC